MKEYKSIEKTKMKANHKSESLKQTKVDTFNSEN